MGKPWTKRAIDHEALRIWNGSGKSYECASITASQCIYESHLTFKKTPVKYRGHVGMQNKTILSEGRRTGLIGRKPRDEKWLLDACLKDSSLADQLAASRFVFLLRIYKTEKLTLYQWVKGEGWKTSASDLKACEDYYDGVMELRSSIFHIEVQNAQNETKRP